MNFVYTTSGWVPDGNCLVKWDHESNVIWSRKWGDTSGFPQVWSNMKRIFTAGNIFEKISQYQSKSLIHVMKWNSIGDIEWNNTYEIENEIVYKLWGNSESLLISAKRIW